MEKMNFKTIVILSLMLAGIIFAACQDEYTNESKAGKLKIQLTDAPFPTDLVSEANVTIIKIEARKADREVGIDPFITLSEKEMSFNLLDLTNGVTAGLVDLEIEAGSYDLIRLYVSDASITLSDGKSYNLKVPSGSQTGIKVFIEPSIVVTGGLTSELLLDIDVSQSFKLQGNINSPAGIKGFIFTPRIKATNVSTAGRLTGNVSDVNETPLAGVQVAIMTGDTVYTTSFTDENGNYTILGIDAGTYNIQFAVGDLEPITIENIEITSGNITTQDLIFGAE